MKTCQKHMGCARDLGHDGPCMGRRGNLVPAYEPVQIITVEPATEEEKPEVLPPVEASGGVKIQSMGAGMRG